MYKVKGAKTSLNAEQSLIGRAVRRFHIHNFIILYHQIILAACCAMRTGGKHLLYLTYLIIPAVLCHQRSRRADCRTVSAGLTGSFLPVRSKGCIN